VVRVLPGYCRWYARVYSWNRQIYNLKPNSTEEDMRTTYLVELVPADKAIGLIWGNSATYARMNAWINLQTEIAFAGRESVNIVPHNPLTNGLIRIRLPPVTIFNGASLFILNEKWIGLKVRSLWKCIGEMTRCFSDPWMTPPSVITLLGWTPARLSHLRDAGNIWFWAISRHALTSLRTHNFRDLDQYPVSFFFYFP
jgi:hypothetical protein